MQRCCWPALRGGTRTAHQLRLAQAVLLGLQHILNDSLHHVSQFTANGGGAQWVAAATVTGGQQAGEGGALTPLLPLAWLHSSLRSTSAWAQCRWCAV
jgi:hypothetical protein